MDLINSIFGGGDKRPRDQNSPVEAGDELIIPFFDQDSEDVLITVKWTQSFSEREAKYYVLTAQNLTLNRAKVVIYVAAEWYDYSDEKNPNHITQIGDFVEDEGHRITVDDRLRYGQKNKDGECRFLVYHDTERNPYQHRFLETTPQAVSARRAQDLAGSLGLGTTAGTVFDFGRSQLGDPLRSF